MKPKGSKSLVKRFFHGMPVVDAKRELRVFILPEDIANAERSNPTECVFAKACKRLFGSHRVAFFHGVAYAELPLPTGSSRIERFMLPKATRDSILVWDRAGVADPGGYLLLPPSIGETLDHKLQWRRRQNYKRPVQKKPPAPVDFRSGTGLVKFLGDTKEMWARQYSRPKA